MKYRNLKKYLSNSYEFLGEISLANKSEIAFTRNDFREVYLLAFVLPSLLDKSSDSPINIKSIFNSGN